MINKKGQSGMMSLPIKLLMMFMVVAILVALVPGMSDLIDSAKQSDSLNCVGYVHNGNANDVLSYNSTIGTKSSLGCLALTLYIPYIILGVLITVVAMIFYGDLRGSQGAQF